MTLAAQLDGALQPGHGLRLAAFGDRSSGLVLQWRARGACPREELDLLGARAADALGLADACLGEGAAAPWVLRFTDQHCEVFAACPPDPENFVALRAEPGRRVASVLAAAQELADAIGGSG